MVCKSYLCRRKILALIITSSKALMSDFSGEWHSLQPCIMHTLHSAFMLKYCQNEWTGIEECGHCTSVWTSLLQTFVCSAFDSCEEEMKALSNRIISSLFLHPEPHKSLAQAESNIRNPWNWSKIMKLPSVILSEALVPQGRASVWKHWIKED